MSRDPEILIVGAGFGGIGAAIELQKHGFHNIRILDRASDLGGTWHYNSYPGSACDVPSHLYSYSFAQRKDWIRICPPRDLILRYAHDVAREHGIEKLVTLDTEVEACRWHDAARRWTVTSTDGRSWEADAVIVATGQLHRKLYPGIEGMDEFEGHSFHSSEWDHDFDMHSKRVAVVGTGASAVQFVPEIVKQAQRVTIFQRTGNWFLPRNHLNYRPSYRWIIRHVPGVQALRRIYIYYYAESLTLMIRHPKTWGRWGKLQSRLFMRKQLKDGLVREQVWPDYTFGCKRILFSSDWLPAIQKPNVEVVTDAIKGLTKTGVVTASGTEHEVDCVVYGTGFKTNDFMFPMEIAGRDGVTLRETWKDGAHAHLGMTIPGFPSLFVMYGPNTNTSGGSIIFYLETQAAYIRQALERLRDSGAAAIEVRREVEEASDRAVQERFIGTAWTQCNSWYTNDSGRVIANWPGYMRDYADAARELDPDEFDLVA